MGANPAGQVVISSKPVQLLPCMHMPGWFKAGRVGKACGIEVNFAGVMFCLKGNGCSALVAEMTGHARAGCKCRRRRSGPSPVFICHAKKGGDGRGCVEAARLAVAIKSPTGFVRALICHLSAKAAALTIGCTRQ